MSGSLFIRLNNAFVFPEPEPPIIKKLNMDDQEFLASLNYVFLCVLL